MKLFALVSLFSLASAATLPNSYLPPPSNAGSAGGSSFLQAPGHSSNFGGQGQQSQQVRTQTSFNHGGQPVSFSQSGYSASSGQGQQYRPQQQSYQQPQQQAYQQQSHQGQQYGGGASHGPQIPILRYENNNPGDGTYNFDYATGNGIMHQESGHINNPGSEHAENVVEGQYSYTGDDGKEYKVQYKADANGFQAYGDHLPTPPPIPEAIQKALHETAIAQGRAPGGGSGGYQQNSYGQQQGAYSAPQGSFASPNKQYLPPNQQQSFNPQTGYQY